MLPVWGEASKGSTAALSFAERYGWGPTTLSSSSSIFALRVHVTCSRRARKKPTRKDHALRAPEAVFCCIRT